MTDSGSNQSNFDPSAYDYMDHMDELCPEGWMWEFIRRSPSYKEKYKKLENELSAPEDFPNKILREHLPGLEKEGVTSISWDFIRESADELRSDCFLDTEVAVVHCDPPPSMQDDFADYPEFRCFEGVPNPKKRFDHLINSNEFSAQDSHFITGLKPFKVGWLSNIDDGSQYRNLIEKLAMPSPEDTLYIGIAEKLKFEDLEKHLIPRLKEILSQRPKREQISKWKNYLISYDLRKKEYTYSEISRLMSQAYPDNDKLYDERNVENYYKKADALIRGGYKAFLHLTD